MITIELLLGLLTINRTGVAIDFWELFSLSLALVSIQNRDAYVVNNVGNIKHRYRLVVHISNHILSKWGDNLK